MKRKTPRVEAEIQATNPGPDAIAQTVAGGPALADAEPSRPTPEQCRISAAAMAARHMQGAVAYLGLAESALLDAGSPEAPTAAKLMDEACALYRRLPA